MDPEGDLDLERRRGDEEDDLDSRVVEELGELEEVFEERFDVSFGERSFVVMPVSGIAPTEKFLVDDLESPSFLFTDSL